MLLHDIQHAIRSLWRGRGITLGIVLCLALGMGATSAIFSVLNAALLKALPFAEADRLVVFYDTQLSPEGNLQEFRVSPLNVDAWKRQNEVFTEIAAAEPTGVSLVDGGEPLYLLAASVTANFFSTLGVKPILGRTISSEEDRVGGAAPVVILSHGLWHRHFGGDPTIVDKAVNLDGRTCTVIGIMPPGVGFPEGLENAPPRDLWMPLGLDPNRIPQGRWHNLFVVGRLGSGVSLEEAQHHMDTIAQRLAEEYPETNTGWGVRLRPMRLAMVGKDVESALFLLMIGVSALLLIACVNVASMLLARAASRGSEVALRVALGAGRGRLLRLMLLESVFLALLGAAAGLLLARLTVAPLVALSELTVPAFREIEIDLSVFGFTLIVAIGTGVLCGLAPALKFLDADVRQVLVEGGQRTGAGRWGRRFQAGLVVGEIALILSLLVGTGLMTRSFQRLLRVEPGFRSDNLLTMRTRLVPSRYPEYHQVDTFVERLLARLETLPGVESATVTSVLPIGDLETLAVFTVHGRPLKDPNEMLLTNSRVVGPDFFPTLGIPIIEGRALSATDRAVSAGVVVVSRHMAEQYWPGQSPLGRQVKRGGPSSEEPWLTIVGVAADVRDSGLDVDIGNTWYLPLSQARIRGLQVVVRVASEPLSLVTAVRREVWSIDPAQAIYDVKTVADMVSGSLARERFSTVLLGTFTTVGLILAVLGIYGIMSYSVHQRTAEIGIRMALGARSLGVQQMILRQGAMLVALGLAIGLFLSFLINRSFVNLLFEIQPSDPSTLAVMAGSLAVVALLATYLPVRRVTRVHPAAVLKSL
jgi:putative ABC transport system permease protein